MKKFLKKIGIGALLFLGLAGSAFALTVAQVPQGGTGTSSITGIVQGNGTAPFTPVTIGTGLTYSGGTLSTSSGFGVPASPSTGIQYNNAGVFGADSNHTIDPTTGFSQLITNDFLATDYPIFSGTGNNDITINGAWTAPVGTVLTITVADGDPTSPNTINWSDTQGNSGSNIPMPSSGFINLSDGLQVAWTADNGTYNTTGHNTGDNWTITQYPASGGLQIGNNIGILTAGSHLYFKNDTNNNVSFLANGDFSTTLGLPIGNGVVTTDNINSPTTVAAFLNGIDASGTPINKLFTQSNSLSAQSFIQSEPEEIDFGVQANGGNTAISMNSSGIYSITNDGSNFRWSDNAGNEYMNLLVATSPVFSVGALSVGNQTFFNLNDPSQSIQFNTLGTFEISGFGNIGSDRIIYVDNANRIITLGDYDYDWNGNKFSVDDLNNIISGTINQNGGTFKITDNASNNLFTVGENTGAGLAVSVFGTSMQYAVTNGITGTYNVTLSDYYLDADTTGGVVTLNLPAANSLGAKGGLTYIITDATRNATVNNITIVPNGSDTIQGLSALVLDKSGDSYTIHSDGVSNWIATSLTNSGSSQTIQTEAFGSTVNLPSGSFDTEFTGGSGASIVNLYTSAPIGTVEIVGDLDAISNTNPITVDAGVGNTINGATINQTYPIDINGETVKLVKVTSTAWKIE